MGIKKVTKIKIYYLLVYSIFLEKAFFILKLYFKPTQVDKQNILKRQDNYAEGTRQINSVTSGERGIFLGNHLKLSLKKKKQLFIKNTNLC